MRIYNRRITEELSKRIREVLALDSPIDLKEAVIRLGGELIENNSLEGDVEAKIICASEAEKVNFKIIINNQKYSSRKKFKIAHEIGHLFLHMGYLTDFWGEMNEYTDRDYSKVGFIMEEYEANEFAAAFLMPKDEFKKIAEEKIDEDELGIEYFYNLNEIAKYFGVSRSAVLTRGMWLGIFG